MAAKERKVGHWARSCRAPDTRASTAAGAETGTSATTPPRAYNQHTQRRQEYYPNESGSSCWMQLNALRSTSVHAAYPILPPLWCGLELESSFGLVDTGAEDAVIGEKSLPVLARALERATGPRSTRSTISQWHWRYCISSWNSECRVRNRRLCHHPTVQSYQRCERAPIVAKYLVRAAAGHYLIPRAKSVLAVSWSKHVIRIVCFAFRTCCNFSTGVPVIDRVSIRTDQRVENTSVSASYLHVA
eukprot:1947929-Amphidinium_carterae.3